MESTVFYGQNAQDQVDAIAGAPASVGLFKFYTTTAIAAAVPGTASVPILLNPANSGVVARIQAVRFGVVAGTVIAGCLLYGVYDTPTLSGLTAGPASVNGFVGRGNTTPLLWYRLATCPAPVIVFPNGISAGGALAAGPLFTMRDDVNGAIAIPPGWAFWPFLANAAVALTALVSVDVLQTPMLDTY